MVRMVKIKEVSTAKEKKEFLNFPLKLYKGNKNFVPPLYGDEKKIFRADYHYYEQAEAKYYLAYRDGKVVGRISGILQKASNEKWGQKRVRFTRFDCIDDCEVAAALLGAVEDWAREKRMSEVVGPLGFSDLEREGLLIEGFDELATFEEQYNYPYYQRLIESCGYGKDVDWLEHKLYLPNGDVNPRLQAHAMQIMERFQLHFGEAKNIGDFLKRYADQIFDVLDETYNEIYGTVPFTEKIKKELIKNFKLIVDLRFVRIIFDKDERPVCFGLCLPSISRAVQPSGGKLTLPTIVRILKSVKNPKIIDLALIGVVDEYKMKGVSSVLINELINMLEENNVEYCETNLNLETNYAILNQWKSFDSVQHKRRRCYKKKI